MYLSKKLKIISSAVLFILSSSTFADSNLPTVPINIEQPYPQQKIISIDSAQSLINQFKKNQYQLTSVIKTNKITPIFVENIPNDLNSLPVEQKVTGFIRLLLPTIIEVNKRILAVRTEVIALSKQPKGKWSQQQNAWINNLMATYGVSPNNFEQLLLRLDVIPVGMVLAQGIDESGWGTSHFAVMGNALYGEHLSSTGGKYLLTPGGHVKVAAFDNLFASTAHYMHNLNTTLAYKDLWQLRQKLSAENKLTGYELVKSLSRYSTRGEAYVKNLQSLINNHQLDLFDKVSFDNKAPVVIRFTN